MKRFYIRIPGYPLPLVSDDLILKRNLHELLINYIALRDSYIKYHKFRVTHYGRDNFKALYYAKLYILSAYEFCELLGLLKIDDSKQLSAHYDTADSNKILKRARNSIAHNKERIRQLQIEHGENHLMKRVKGSAMDGTMIWKERDGVDYIEWVGPPILNIDWFNLEAGTAEGDFWHDCLINDYYYLMDKSGRIEINLAKSSEEFVSNSQKILQNTIDSYEYSSIYNERL